MALKWNDVQQLAVLLYDKHPDIDPLSVRFTDLRDRVLALPDFEDDVKKLNEQALENIQMAWLDEYQAAEDEE